MADVRIEIYGYADQAICSGCESHESPGGCTACSPGEKRKTMDLVRDFDALLAVSEYKGHATVEFVEADGSIAGRAPEVHRLLSMADLAPAIAVNGKVLYLGGFSPSGLLAELRKRYPPSI
jgi:hypothetical protein